jgi:ligand-binding sensor domain-containing protein
MSLAMHQNRTALFLLLSCLSLWLRGQELVFKNYGLQDGLANPTIHSIFQDRNGFLWIGTESGLCRYDGNSFKTFTVKDGLPGNEVFGMFEDRQERLWLQQYKNTIGYIHHGKVYNQQMTAC